MWPYPAAILNNNYIACVAVHLTTSLMEVTLCLLTARFTRNIRCQIKPPHPI